VSTVAADDEDMQRSASVSARPVARGRIDRALLVCCVWALLLCGLAGSAAAPASAAEAGVNLIGSTSAQMPAVQALGTHWVRMFASWPDLEPTKDTFSTFWLSYYEETFRSLPSGTKVLLDVVDTPSWETGSGNPQTPPANPQEYAAFAGALAQRFGTKVAAYEIWNEEDSSAWWAGGPNPAAYTQLLKAAYPAIKAANPNATVVLGGLTGNDFEFLEGVYAAGGKGSFDAVGVHTDTACDVISPYDFVRGAGNRMIADSFLAYREVHAVMLANGDDKPIWMTELSWRTTSATCAEGAFAGQKAGGVTEEEQATFLQQAYHCLAQAPYVQVALWFPLEDEGAVTSGLLRSNGTRKPAFAAMQAYAREGDKLNGSCGVLTGPTITVASPANHVTYRGPLPISVSAKSSEGVFRIRLEIDGKLIRNYDSPDFASSLFGALDWQGAKHIPYGWHTLTFLAYDKENNVSRTSIRIYHARPLRQHHGKH
jgi:Cellulase (glycosyl hydrolase family 5)